MDSTTDEAAKYLWQRWYQLNDRYRDSWPRWTTHDFVALGMVLRDYQTRHATATDCISRELFGEEV